MQESILRSLEEEGVLPSGLNLRRKAANYYIRTTGYKESLQSRGLVFAYALAVSKVNASGGIGQRLRTDVTTGGLGHRSRYLCHRPRGCGCRLVARCVPQYRKFREYSL